MSEELSARMQGLADSLQAEHLLLLALKNEVGELGRALGAAIAAIRESEADIIDLRSVVHDDHDPRITKVEARYERLMGTTTTTLLVVNGLERMMKRIGKGLGVDLGDEVTR